MKTITAAAWRLRLMTSIAEAEASGFVHFAAALRSLLRQAQAEGGAA